MRNLFLLFLLVLGLCVITASKKDLSQITWINSLTTTDALDAYLKSTHGMAREGVSLKLPPTPIEPALVVMGRSSAGELTLIECLTRMKKEKKDFQQLFLEVPNEETFNRTMQILKDKVPTVNWITLNTRPFWGPNGFKPAIPPGRIRMGLLRFWLAKNIKKSFGMTTAYVGKDKGYSFQVLDKFSGDYANSNIYSLPSYDFCFDIYHVSHSDLKQLNKTEKRIMKNLGIHIFFINEEMQDKVNMTNFKAYLDTIDVKRSFFNVPDKFRNKLFPNESGSGYKVVDKASVIIVVVFIGRILFKYLN